MSIASLTVDLTANLSRFEADMGKGAQIATRFAEQSARAQTTFLRSLERTSERLGKTEADFLRVRAAEVGASDAAEKLISRIELAGGASVRAGAAGAAAFNAAGAAADALSARQRATTAELLSGLRSVTAEGSRLRAQAIAEERAGTIGPDQLKSRLTNVNAGTADAIGQLKEAAAAEQAQNRVAEAIAKRTAATEALRSTVAKLNYNEQQSAAAKLKASQDAAAASAENFATRIEKMAGSIGKSRHELLAMEAAELNLTARLGPAIAKIAEFDARTGQLGKSVFGTKNQLLTLHYTLSDVVASLASGISPLTILLQQGGQVYDAFGNSFTNIFKTIGTLITPARLAIGGLAAAVGTFAYAAYHGAQQSKEFADAVVLTGNFAGVTESRFNAMAKAISASGQVSISSAREFGQAIVATGEIGPAVLEKAIEASARYGAATGKNAKEVATDFASMGTDVAKWATDHNRQLNFVTAAQLEHIRVLQEQGKTVAAQSLVYDLLNERFRKLEPNLGTLDRLLRGTTNVWHEFWNAAFDVGRTETIDQKIDAARAALEIAKRRLNDAPSVSVGGGNRPDSRETIRAGGAANLQDKQDAVNDALKAKLAQDQAAQATAELAQLNKNASGADDFVRGFERRSKAASGLKRELESANAEFAKQDALAARDPSYKPSSASTRASIIKKIHEDYTDKPAINQAERVRERELEQSIKALEDLLRRERSDLDFHDSYVAAVYAKGSLTLEDFYGERQDAAERAEQATQRIYAREIAALRTYLAATKDPSNRVSAETKIAETEAKAATSAEDRARRVTLANEETAAGFKALDDRIAEYRANLLQLRGDEAGAALLRSQQAIAAARIFATQAAKRPDGGLVDVGALERATAAANAFADIQRKVGIATADLSRAEEAYLLRAEQGGAGLLEQDRAVYQLRAAALVQLGELLEKTTALAKASADPKIKAAAADLALQYAKAADAVDPAFNRLRAASKEFAGTVSSDVENAILHFKGLNDLVNNIGRDLHAIALRKIVIEPFEKGLEAYFNEFLKGDNPIANFLKDAFGVSSISDGTAAQRAAVLESTSALISLTAAASGAATALGGKAGASSAGGALAGLFGKYSGTSKNPSDANYENEFDKQNSAKTASEFDKMLSEITGKFSGCAVFVDRLKTASGDAGSALTRLPSIIASLLSASGSAVSSGFGALGSLFGAGGGGGTVTTGSGLEGLSSEELAYFFHAGGVVGRTADVRSVPAGIFAGATRYHTGGRAGLAPDEVPAVLRRGEEVLTRSNPRHRDNRNAAQRAPMNYSPIFQISGPIDQQTQAQLAATAYQSALRAHARNN
jgi:hypothetical protein